MIKKYVSNVLNFFGYKIQKNDRPQNFYNVFTMENALERCAQRGLEINTVVDVGASNGSWSKMCMNYLPNSKYLLIEAQNAHRDSLELFKLKNKNVEYIISAAGNKNGIIYFDNSELLGGVASESPFDENNIEVPEITIDEVVKLNKLLPPYLIKLDTHGFEKAIIDGAFETLKNANLLIIEAYNYQITNDSLKYYELCQYMSDLGFASIEIADLMLRECDSTFWQMDIFFIPKTSKEFLYNSYK